jgi:hypothetical protein
MIQKAGGKAVPNQAAMSGSLWWKYFSEIPTLWGKAQGLSHGPANGNRPAQGVEQTCDRFAFRIEPARPTSKFRGDGGIFDTLQIVPDQPRTRTGF